MYRHILIPTDGSEFATRAVAVGVELARRLGARLTFLAVSAPLATLGGRAQAFPGVPESVRRRALDYLEDEAQGNLQAAARLAEAAGVSSENRMVEAEEVHTAIVDVAAATGVDLIVMGSHGRTGAAALLLGSVTQKVLTHTKIPVLVVR